MASFTGPFGHAADESREAAVTRPFDVDGYDPRFPSQRFDSQRFDSFSSFAGNESAKEGAEDYPYGAGDDVFASQPVAETLSTASIYTSGGGFSPEHNGSGDFVASDGPVLPPPGEMHPEEGFALREWRRLNVIRLEEKEKREKELLREIIAEADGYRAEFYRKWTLMCENNKDANREKEKQFVASREKFHAEASKNSWRVIGELIPKEVPTIERRGKKDQAKKPSVVVIQGPKPGKPTDLARMRHILVKLKHNPPPHMKPPPPPPQPPSAEPEKDAKTGPSPPAATAPAKPVAVAGLDGLAAP